jgi:phosphoadenosine phosphosulfate reductase
VTSLVPARPPLSRGEVDELADRFEGASPQAILAWTAARFGARAVLTCSWQRQSSVLVHLVASAAPAVRIVELDTGLLFPETYATRDVLVERYGLRVERITPRRTPEEQEAKFGERLWERHPDRCCAMRKVEPLERALVGADAWITGIRREQSPTRAGARAVELDEGRGVVKVQPLVAWTAAQVDAYLAEHAIPVHPLHAAGYPSIGCVPCTRAVRAGEDERAGRWSGRAKTECGLHAAPSSERAPSA